ncbi:hypothetical protein EYR36_005675 [Pleurotus pulmonarius]|nr:hypothetical protein EYR36_005675 [Pleurotus pulmonarius]
MAFIAQLFFASRIWIARAGYTLVQSSYLRLPSSVLHLRFMSVQTGTTALADILSSIGLCYTLQSSRSGISRTDAVIGKLMKYSIHRAIATTAAAVLTVALLVSISQTTAFMIPLLVSGQLYVISVVSILYGVSLLLIGLYFLSPARPNDSVFVKCTVAFLSILGTAEMLCLFVGIEIKMLNPSTPNQVFALPLGEMVFMVSLMALVAQLYGSSFTGSISH